MPVSEGTVITTYVMRISTVPVDNATKPSKHLAQILLFWETAQIAKESSSKDSCEAGDLEQCIGYVPQQQKQKKTDKKHTYTMQNVKIICKENQIF